MNDDNQSGLSADDALEDTRDEQTVPIPQNDDDNPAGPATDAPQVVVPPDHPSTDSDVDATESYQEADDVDDTEEG